MASLVFLFCVHSLFRFRYLVGSVILASLNFLIGTTGGPSSSCVSYDNYCEIAVKAKL